MGVNCPLIQKAKQSTALIPQRSVKGLAFEATWYVDERAVICVAIEYRSLNQLRSNQLPSPFRSPFHTGHPIDLQQPQLYTTFDGIFLLLPRGASFEACSGLELPHLEVGHSRMAYNIYLNCSPLLRISTMSLQFLQYLPVASILAVVLFPLLLWTFNGVKDPKEPPMVPSWLPWIGCGLEYLRDTTTFLNKNRLVFHPQFLCAVITLPLQNQVRPRV